MQFPGQGIIARIVAAKEGRSGVNLDILQDPCR